MKLTDFHAAREYVSEKLATGLSPDLVYHNQRHTFEDVMVAVVRLGRMAGLDAESMLMLKTAAMFHDTGFLERYQGHESISMIIARNALPGFGYDDPQIERITRLIAVTRMPQRPTCPLEAIMCDADLELLGRDDFWLLNQLLYIETCTFHPKPPTLVQWYESQIKFMLDHSFFSPQARALRNAGKARNLLLMRRALVEAQHQPVIRTSAPSIPVGAHAKP